METEWILWLVLGAVIGALEAVFTLLIELRNWFNPLVIVNDYEMGVVLRWGRYSRTIGPGLHWYYPCSVENPTKATVVRRTSYLDVQSLTSKDGKSVNSSPIVIYKIGNIRRWLLEVDDAEEALNDVTYGLNDQLAANTNWKDIHTDDYAVQLTALVKEEGVTWGARVEKVKFSDRVQSKSMRLWTGSGMTSDEEE